LHHVFFLELPGSKGSEVRFPVPPPDEGTALTVLELASSTIF
jgi:hypothetical protein